MTLDEFWHSNPRIMGIYVDAHNIRVEEQDRLNWYLGTYIMSAIGACFGKDKRYDKEPHLKDLYEDSRLTQEERDEKEIRRQIADMETWSQKNKDAGLKTAFSE